MQFTYLSPLQMRKFSLTNLPSRICTLIKFSLTCFVARAHGMLLNIYITSRLPLFARTIEMFLLHLSRFPRRPYTRTRLAWLWLEQGSLAGKNVNFLPCTRASKTCQGIQNRKSHISTCFGVRYDWTDELKSIAVFVYMQMSAFFPNL